MLRLSLPGRQQTLLPSRRDRGRPRRTLRSYQQLALRLADERGYLWLATIALLACAALAAAAYFRAQERSQPSAPSPLATGTGVEDLRAAEEAEAERLLHAEPSPEYCSREGSPPLVCGHGGDPSAAPPNTARAFQAALAAGVNCLEVDVARTKDGVLVVLHARQLAALLALPAGRALAAAWRATSAAWARTLQQPQAGDFTWAQLQQLRWQGGEGVEAAASVLALLLPAARHVTLDLKPLTQGGTEVDGLVLAEEVVDLLTARATAAVREACRLGRCLVWAKSDGLVRAVKERAPQLQAGYIVMNETQQARAAGMQRLLRLPQAEVVGLHHLMAEPALVQQARAAGKGVHAWTADTAGMMTRALEAGVDAVVTSHPRQLLAALEARERACAQRRRQ